MRKGQIVHVSATHFQEERTGPPGAKRQCLECLDPDDFEWPIRTAWFTDPNIDCTAQTNSPTTPATPATSAILPILQEHEPSASAKQDFNLQSQNNLSAFAISFANLAVANTLAMIANMAPEELYKPKSWKDTMLYNSCERWLQAANNEIDLLISNKT
jgi:hypothetical protein